MPEQPHRILIADEPFGRIDVIVVPAPSGVGHDRDLQRHADASAYASRLGAANGWLIVDRSTDGAGDAG